MVDVGNMEETGVDGTNELVSFLPTCKILTTGVVWYGW